MTTLHLRKSIGFLIPLAFVCLAFFAPPSSRGDAQCNWAIPTNWRGGTGDWFVPSNWDNGVPICVSPAGISNGGTAQITSTDPTAEACETFLAYTSGTSGNLSVNGRTLHTCNELHVGEAGAGKLTITNSGNVSTTFAGDIGAMTGSNGSTFVDGTNSQWTIAGGGALYVAGTYKR